MTLTSRLTRGTSTRIENVSLLGFLILGCSGAGGGGGSVGSFFLGMTMGPLSTFGPLLSGVWVAGGAGAWASDAAGRAVSATRMSAARSLRVGRIGEIVVIF